MNLLLIYNTVFCIWALKSVPVELVSWANFSKKI